MSAEVKLSIQEGVAALTLQRNAAGLQADAALLRNLGQVDAAEVLEFAASQCAKVLETLVEGQARRLVVPSPVLPPELVRR